MTSKASKLLERMRHSKAGWKRKDIDTLYLGFGFIITPGKSHDIVKHPDFPQLRDTLPRQKSLAKGYVKDAIKLIEELERLKKDQERQQDE